MGRLLVILILVVVVAGAIWYMRAAPPGAGGGGGAGPTAGAPTNQADLYARADGHFAQSEYGMAVGAYQQALAKDPGNAKAPEARYRIGYSLDRSDKPDEALKAYREYVDAFPSDDPERMNQAKKRIEFLVGTGAK